MRTSEEAWKHPADSRHALIIEVGGVCSDIAEGVAQGAVKAAGVCPADEDRHFNPAENVPGEVRDPDLDKQLLHQLRTYLGLTKRRDFEGAFELLSKLQGANAKDVFALQETWTEADTDILRQLDNAPEAFVPGAWRTEVFVERLPTARDLDRVVRDRPTAIIGSVDALDPYKFGPAIDAHEAVVRVGSDIGAKLEQRSTGTRTTAHASGSGDGPVGDPDVAEFDLEASRPWASYCRKMHRAGDLASDGPLFILRPSVLCKMGEAGGQLSVAFLFYWFVGRLSKGLDLYGFVQGGGEASEFELLLYSIASALEGQPALHPMTASELKIITAIMPSTSPAPPPPPPPPPPRPPSAEGEHPGRAHLAIHRNGAPPAVKQPARGKLPGSPMAREALEAPGKQWPIAGLCGMFGKKENPTQVGKTDTDGVCPEGDTPRAIEITDVGLPVRNVEEDRALLDDLRRRIDGLFASDPARRESLEGAWGLLKRLQSVNAKDVFALRETWTDADTEILRKLDGGRGGFVPMELTTAAFRERLPTAAHFTDAVLASGKGTVAMVGAGASLNDNRFGAEIDSHDIVVRFNRHIGSDLHPETTGTKMTIHVSCDNAPPVGDPYVAEFDLETGHPWNSYCLKMHMGGLFSKPEVFGFMMRPSFLCSMGKDGSLFTRGFLFYWFVGRLFDHLDMYGFQGKGHFDSSNEVWEPFLEFEHLAYASAAGSHFADSLEEEWRRAEVSTTRSSTPRSPEAEPPPPPADTEPADTEPEPPPPPADTEPADTEPAVDSAAQ